MRIQPREQILKVWEAMLASCLDNGRTWRWGGQGGVNSISDSEQLLCLLYPATEIDTFAVHNPDRIEKDVEEVLQVVGGRTLGGAFLVKLLTEYIDNNTDAEGEPSFASGDYLRSSDERPVTAAQRQVQVVDSYSMSLTVCMAGLRFLRDHITAVWQGRPDAEMERLQAGVSARLTAAMTGLVRSFVVNTMFPKSPEGQAIIKMLNAEGRSEASVVDGIKSSLERVRARLRSDVVLGQENSVLSLENDNLLFECGWSWGIPTDASPVGFIKAPIASSEGIAESRPYLYFTMVALDGINDLFSPRAGEMGMLDEHQHRLAQALRTRWELTQLYWSTVARFGDGKWPLEDIPWRTSDGLQSDYYSLIVSAVLIQDLVERTASDDDLTRAVAIFDELAGRGRIIRRPTADDPAVGLHMPGVRLRLRGTEKIGDGPLLVWEVSDYAPVLLKRMLQAARLSNNVAARDRLMDLCKETMDHLFRRRLDVGAPGLWDDPGKVFGGRDTPRETVPSWYMTERLIECFVAAERTYRSSPPNWPELQAVARVMLDTAEHRFDQELLSITVGVGLRSTGTMQRVENLIDESRRLVRNDAAAALVRTLEALRELDNLTIGRHDADRNV
ncbi:SCO2524 family protein [Nocardia arizonensis]|uniref:SCO2524 family protein n=1 Tax=Nocardia arizonensis TaxID=1141647 RepID=UPI0006D02226|nr:SCO2524 family protein [Nocardia arizonensis]